VGETTTLLELRLCQGTADFKKVGLTRCGPPTCRQRRDWLRRAEENSRRSRIPSHLTLRAKVGRPRRVSPTGCRRRAPPRMEQSSIHHWRQQSVPHSGVREALLAPMAAPALPDAARSSSCVREDKRKSSDPIRYFKFWWARRPPSLSYSGLRGAFPVQKKKKELKFSFNRGWHSILIASSDASIA
jgi:hypothetical protein